MRRGALAMPDAGTILLDRTDRATQAPTPETRERTEARLRAEQERRVAAIHQATEQSRSVKVRKNEARRDRYDQATEQQGPRSMPIPDTGESYPAEARATEEAESMLNFLR